MDEKAPVAIRPFCIGHYHKAAALWRRIPGMGLRSVDDSLQGIARFLDRNPDTSFAAFSGDALVGAILCGHDGRRGYIYHTYVDPDFRGASVGRLLCEYALAALKKEGITRAALVCFKDNDVGNGFWAAMGWQRRDDLFYYGYALDDGNI
ncbi:MAG: GNAT family N-acetyltransferase [Oscillospiraceae bacterium]|jgi:ribosomal protein S18 acetylase RimI-like enzyme|nr:GNAT family N-acetyltransferase [Oscillospiraceae bacterium]